MVLPDGFFQEASWYTGCGRERESHSALRRTGVDAPTSPPTSPCTFPSPSQVRFLQFVKLVIIFLGAFFLFFKCKVYLYSIFKVVKKKATKPNQTNPPEVCLLASGVTINLSMLAGCASSLLRVPLTQGGQTPPGILMCPDTLTRVHSLAWLQEQACVSGRERVGPGSIARPNP